MCMRCTAIHPSEPRVPSCLRRVDDDSRASGHSLYRRHSSYLHHHVKCWFVHSCTCAVMTTHLNSLMPVATMPRATCCPLHTYITGNMARFPLQAVHLPLFATVWSAAVYLDQTCKVGGPGRGPRPYLVTASAAQKFTRIDHTQM